MFKFLTKSVRFGVVGTVLGAVTMLASANSQAYVLSQNFNSLGEQNSPGSITWNVNTTAGSATLNFELAGYASLDGYNNCCTDIFHLFLNGSEIFTGSFNLGGGGSNTVLFNPNGGSALTTTFGASDDPHNSQQVTWAGGVTEISIPVNLILGANQFDFTYSGGAQGLGDEGWGINQATLTSSSVPEPSAFTLLAVGLFGLFASRRKNI